MAQNSLLDTSRRQRDGLQEAGASIFADFPIFSTSERAAVTLSGLNPRPLYTVLTLRMDSVRFMTIYKGIAHVDTQGIA
jgi:hypothetical protein